MSGGRKHLFLLAAVVFLVAAGFVQRSLETQRRSMGLAAAAADLKGAPPMLAFSTMALGGFRGLIANILWIRASQLQEEDKFFEMVQLSDWITKLQPRMKQVWIHLAWNMSYNISVKFSDHEDRWRWVQRGIELLRDEALKYNPDEPLIYRELAWHFQHKMGMNLDDANLLYKRRWMDEMTAVLGSTRDSYKELISPKTDDARARLKILREKYKMDPRRMLKADDAFGPLEWRLPEASAIYWAMAGMEKCRPAELMDLRRPIYQSMQLAFQRGRLVLPRSGATPILGPNLDIIPQVNKAYEQNMAEEPAKADQIKTGHKNFLLQAVVHLYTHNRLKEAATWWDYLKKLYPDASAVKDAGGNLDTFALSRVTEGVAEKDVNKLLSLIEGFLRNSYLDLSLDYDDRAEGSLLMARRIYNNYVTQLRGSQEVRVPLPPMLEISRKVLDDLLAPQSGMPSELQLVLRTRLGLPPPTNAPPSTSTPQP
jgi:hypothetical protein